jgi:hypothetical protein
MAQQQPFPQRVLGALEGVVFMRRIVASTLFLVVVSYVIASVMEHGSPSVNAADRQLVRTERRLAEALVENQGAARKLEDGFAKGLPGVELGDFARTTQRIERLVEQLQTDIERFVTARDAAITAVDNEVGLVRDTGARQHVQDVRDAAVRDASARVELAQALVGELRSALVQAADLRHAATALQLAQRLRSDGEELARQTEQARTTLAAYRQQTSGLLARLQPLLGS